MVKVSKRMFEGTIILLRIGKLGEESSQSRLDVTCFIIHTPGFVFGAILATHTLSRLSLLWIVSVIFNSLYE